MSRSEALEAEARAREPLLEPQQRENGGDAEASEKDVLQKQEEMERFGLRDAFQARTSNVVPPPPCALSIRYVQGPAPRDHETAPLKHVFTLPIGYAVPRLWGLLSAYPQLPNTTRYHVCRPRWWSLTLCSHFHNPRGPASPHPAPSATLDLQTRILTRICARGKMYILHCTWPLSSTPRRCLLTWTVICAWSNAAFISALPPCRFSTR